MELWVIGYHEDADAIGPGKHDINGAFPCRPGGPRRAARHAADLVFAVNLCLVGRKFH